MSTQTQTIITAISITTAINDISPKVRKKTSFRGRETTNRTYYYCVIVRVQYKRAERTRPDVIRAAADIDSERTHRIAVFTYYSRRLCLVMYDVIEECSGPAVFGHNAR